MLNPLFKFILRSPLHGLLSGHLLLLTFRGRRSGKEYTVPLGYAEVERVLLSGTASGWKHNLYGGVPVGVRLRGRDLQGIADIVDDEDGMAEAYKLILAHAPGYGRSLSVRVEPDGWTNREDVARARSEGHVVVRTRLD